MKFSLWPSPGRDVAEVLDLARWADANGWFGLWFADHYMPNTDDGSVADGPIHEAWSMLPAVATVTDRIRIGPLVSPTTVHHPALLANRATTIDHLSNGRFVLGLGAGWQVNEHRAYGFELLEPGARVARFEEAIQVVRMLTTSSRTTFRGDHFTIVDAPCDPPPVQDRLPILVGSGSPRMMRITARHADEWNTWGSLALATERHSSFVDACDAVGRDPATVRRSVQAMLFVTDDAARGADSVAAAGAERSLAGSVGHLVDTLAQYAEVGFDEFIVPDFTLGRDAVERRDRYELIAAEIVAQLA
jgi:alkanesulfonate monooxygenase SsuD/methylene tetrahydromethanopterin reductase-like flavin-dependent oxidoreductase (luciferase family)